MATSPDPTWRDGMRSLRADEFPQLEALLGQVFRPSIVAEYTHLYTPENAPHLRVVVEDGRVVSHMATLRRPASLLGCAVRAASLGGVATHPDYRGRGHATALFADTLRACRQDGVDFIIVSGYRKLYHRYGCRYVGRFQRFRLPRADAAHFSDPDLELRPATHEDVPALSALHAREPVRWLRPPSDFHCALDGFVMNRPHRFLCVSSGGRLRAYVILQKEREQDQGRVQILECAGERRALCAILGRLLADFDLQELSLHVAAEDALFQDLLQERGLQGEPAAAAGTVVLVDFPQLFERLRPLLLERAGRDAEGLVLHQQDDAFALCWGADRVVLADAGDAASLLFGTPDGSELALLEGGGRAAEVLRQVFPVPALWFGMNYI